MNDRKRGCILKKVGILSFHKVINYGAVLQSYALNRTFRELGTKCEHIDYTAIKIKESYDPFVIKTRGDFHTLIDYMAGFTANRLTEKRFNIFIGKYIPTSRNYTQETLNDARGKYDLLVCGSDQIWNTDLTGNDYAYFLNFDNSSKKVSYAASFGKTSLSDDIKEQVKECLDDFSIITVREESASELLREIVNNESTVVPDPVFLLHRNEWEKLCRGKRIVKEKYILLFILHDNASTVEFAEKLSNNSNFKLISISNSIKRVGSSKKVKGCGPEEFLKLIRDAEYVITDSFHASAMSIIFNKKLYIGLKEGNLASLNTRIDTLAKKFQLRDRIIRKGMTINESMNFDYINNQLEKEKKFGRENIVKMISLVKSDE